MKLPRIPLRLVDSFMHATSIDSSPLEPRSVWNTTVAGQALQVFVELGPYIEAVLEDIRRAQQRIWIETYILGNDRVGQAITAALAKRAAEGLDVRLMVDAIGSLRASNKMLGEIVAAGGKVHSFHSFGWRLWDWLNLRRLNRRNHRKLLLIDEDIAYLGGMNFVDPREGMRDDAWRDVHVRVQGELAKDVAAAMERLWQRVHGEKVEWPPWPVQELQVDGPDTMLLFDSLPSVRMRRAARVFVPLIRQARKQITLSMAYFVPQGAILRALLKARKRGVVIRVLVPGVSDVPIVQYATEYLYARLLKAGVKVYERRDLMLHSKTMVVDDRWSIVGSCNLDPLSLRRNLEVLAAIRSRSFADILKQIVAQEQKQSRRITDEYLANRSWWRRMLCRLAWMVRDWL